MVVRGKPFPIFNLAGYLESVGADLDALQEVHLAGGRRVAILKGAELRRVRDQLHFAFTKRDRGKARMDWPDAPIEISTRIDVISGVYAYQLRKPPGYDRKTGSFHFDDGVAIEGVPYAERPQPSTGTRLYVDGRLRRALRKRDVGDPVTLQALLPSPTPALGVDLIARDESVIHRSGPAWQDGLQWSLQDGRLSVRTSDAENASSSELAAVQVYAKVRPKPPKHDPLPSN